jgi:hypothetical protein
MFIYFLWGFYLLEPQLKAIQEVGNNLSQIHFSIYGGGENLVAFKEIFNNTK